MKHKVFRVGGAVGSLSWHLCGCAPYFSSVKAMHVKMTGNHRYDCQWRRLCSLADFYSFLLHLLYQRILIKHWILKHSRVSVWVFKVQRVFNIPGVQIVLQPAGTQTNNNYHKVTTLSTERKQWIEPTGELIIHLFKTCCSSAWRAFTFPCPAYLRHDRGNTNSSTRVLGMLEKQTTWHVYHFTFIFNFKCFHFCERCPQTKILAFLYFFIFFGFLA